jgi:hypothetical protein
MDAPYGPVSAWQAMLERHRPQFEELASGSGIGFVPREGSGILPGRRAAVCRADDSEPVAMLTWECREGGMRACVRPFAGFEQAGVDLLFVADEVALDAMRQNLGADALGTMKRLIRRGNLVFYVLRARRELQDAGYEEFLDSLGLAFLGACR